MFIEQLYTNCLAQAAYYIESEGEAAIIDPIREVDSYVAKANERGAKINYIFETHFHADFVSGHLELAQVTGAPIVFGPGATTSFNAYNAHDGEVFKIGAISIKVLHTPGHTPESVCYLVIDESGREVAIFTGDTLFVGDVGRPDLLDGKMAKEDLAGMMFDSLNTKLKPLSDDITVYPGHGPGSGCGKNIGKETWSTIGHQKRTNYALLETSKEAFIKVLTHGLTPAPQYYFKDAVINKKGYENLHVILERSMRPLTATDVASEMNNGAMVLDTRRPHEFETGFIPGAISIGLNGSYAIWAGTLIPLEQKLIIVAEPGKEKEAVSRLARVGFEHVSGYLDGGLASWKRAGFSIDTVNSVQPSTLLETMGHGYELIDIRKPSEFDKGHLEEAKLLPLSEFNDRINTLDPNHPYLIQCDGGYRSMIAVSLMKARGFKNVCNVAGGFQAIRKLTSLPIVTEAVATA